MFIRLRSIEHVRKESECHWTPPHPTKPLRAFAENENLRGVQAKMVTMWKNLTGSPVTPPAERPSKKETIVSQPSIFRGENISFRVPGTYFHPTFRVGTIQMEFNPHLVRAAWIRLM